MQENGIHDIGTELGDEKPVLQQVFLIVGAVVGNELFPAFSLMKLKVPTVVVLPVRSQS